MFPVPDRWLGIDTGAAAPAVLYAALGLLVVLHVVNHRREFA
jgi:hypothetical protein